MTKPFFRTNRAAYHISPSEPAAATLVGILQAEPSLSKRLVVIAQLSDQLIEGPLADQRSILDLLCAFIRARTPLVGPRSLHAVPAEDVQAALNVLAARPRQQGPNGNEFPLDLRDTDLTGAWLASAHFRLARFDRASLRMVDLSYAEIEGASFRDADLGGATLAHSRSTGADFCGARLHNVDLTGTARSEGGEFKEPRAMAS